MNVVILQPSYVPWRGYFHQIAKADLFIFYDDVQYDKHGWRNRNRVKTINGTCWMTIPVHAHGAVEDGLPIARVRMDDRVDWRARHWRMLCRAYGKAPYFGVYREMLEGFYARRDAYLADFTIETTVQLTRALGIRHTRFARSSEYTGITGTKTDRLISLLTRVGCTRYISGPSARDYLERDKLEQAGIALEFMAYDYPEYPQLYPPFDPQVSIIDLLAMTGPDAMRYVDRGWAEVRGGGGTP